MSSCRGADDAEAIGIQLPVHCVSANQTNRARVTRYQLEEFVSGLYNIQTVFNSPTCQAVFAGPLANCQKVYSDAVGPGGRFDTMSQATQDAYALFGEATFSLTKTLDLTASAAACGRPARSSCD